MDTTQYELFLDIGNTNVKAALADAERGLSAAFALPTRTGTGFDTPDGWGFKLLDVCRVEGVDPARIGAVVVSSVVPSMNPLIRSAAERFFHLRALFVPADIPLDIENRYARPLEVGADRLVTAYAARRRSAAETLVVVDFGTATTLDCVRGGAYLGGLICPGLLSAAHALSSGTAQLPQSTLEISGPLHLGRSTEDSLNQGLVYGFAAMIEGLTRRIFASLGARPEDSRVFATGGFARTIAAVCPAIQEVREDLLMEGLFHAWAAARGREIDTSVGA